MPGIGFDFTISVGNILTILGGIIVAVLGLISIETANAGRDARVDVLTEKVRRNELVQKEVVAIKEDLIRVQEGHKNNYRMLVRIVKHLEK